MSDSKITPIGSIINNDRRPLRSTTRKNYNEGSLDLDLNGTGEKISKRKDEMHQQENVLGKRLRNGRSRGLDVNEEEIVEGIKTSIGE